MADNERAVFESLPKTIAIWRGSKYHDVRDAARGPSWSLDRELAEHFAWLRGGTLVRAEVDKSKVLAYFERENELFVDFRAPRNAELVAHASGTMGDLVEIAGSQ